MATLYHPTARGVTVDVPKADTKAWRAAGWLTKPPAQNVPATASDETHSQPREDAANDKE